MFNYLIQASWIVCGDRREPAYVCRFSIKVQAPVMLLLIPATPSLNVESGALCGSKP